MIVQVELQDTYRSVHKLAGPTQILIRPEIYGTHIDMQDESMEVA